MIRTLQNFERNNEGNYVNRKWVPGGQLGTFQVLASVQPATSGDYDMLEALPGGRRVEKVVRVYTGEALNVAGQDRRGGDILLWEGDRYVVTAVSPWRSTILKHYRYLATKELEK